MKAIEDYTVEECLQLMAKEQYEQGETLKSMRRHIVIIAIPFWLIFCSALAGIAFIVFGVGLGLS